MINFKDAVKIVRNNINKGWAILYGCGDENCYIFLTSPSANDNIFRNVGYLEFFVKDAKRYGEIPLGTDKSKFFFDVPKDTKDKIESHWIKVFNPDDPDITFVDATYKSYVG